MKITTQQLRQVIREELRKTNLREAEAQVKLPKDIYLANEEISDVVGGKMAHTF